MWLPRGRSVDLTCRGPRVAAGPPNPRRLSPDSTTPGGDDEYRWMHDINSDELLRHLEVRPSLSPQRCGRSALASRCAWAGGWLVSAKFRCRCRCDDESNAGLEQHRAHVVGRKEQYRWERARGHHAAIDQEHGGQRRLYSMLSPPNCKCRHVSRKAETPVPFVAPLLPPLHPVPPLHQGACTAHF